MSTDGGAPFKFDALVDLDAGANTVTVEARDGQNNVSTKSYSVPTTGTSKHYEYDGNGNMRFEKDGSGAVLKEYQWDQQNRLVKALLGTHESDYFYDGESRRVRIKELESGTQTKDETFVWCGSRICQKRSGSTVQRNYFEQGFEEGTADYSYTRDHLGSVREVVGSDGTTVASRTSYDPWGKSTGTGAGALADFGFTGHYFDRPTGLDLTRHRGYDPGLGRWLSRDPIGLRAGTNVYGYVDQNPILFIDSTGLSKSQCEGDESPKPRPAPPNLPWVDIPDPVLDCEVKCSSAVNNNKTADCLPTLSPAEMFICLQDWDLLLNSCLNYCNGELPASPIPRTFPTPSDHPNIQASR